MPNSTTPNTSTDIELVVLDMAGTTVTDDGLVLDAFDVAATAVGLASEGPERDDARRYVLDTMGQSKIEVFRALFGTEDRAQAANRAFESAYDARIDDGIAPVPGAAQAITKLRESGISVVLTTGFSAPTQERIIDTLGWQDLPDAFLAPGEAGRGRPHPDLVLTAALFAEVSDIAAVAVVGDTSSDILSGRRAGASLLVGVLTGAHSVDRLREAGATHVLDSVADLPPIVLP
ncbi:MULTISPECIES: phosphonatase-like hydrolase [unclassified Rhodococcus (in: high G+C Gram-positive bacteria)]|uniref:phosphonatase-like hydrolase n=1 Tax=unclassified Rhodococcus (in: high G+C Gram-positive bacteria) TaxID=192944 RepID=UPI001594F77C|nr:MULTISPECIES: phosphonatase-like hydrolase [unclassified Rhodococcus (in: high G+C Gram-positive bacteria)]